MFEYILKYLIVLIVFLIIDLLWIGVIAKKMYAKKLGYLMKQKPNLKAAVIFYLLYIVGLMVFIVIPSIQKNSSMYALLYGGIFGIIAYATYDFTNLATIKDWPISITIIDTVWGGILTALTCFFGYNLINMIW